MESLTGKTALVTGGSRGIGRATARSLATRGCAIAINYLHSAEDASSLLQEVRDIGSRACMVQADVSHPDEVTHMVNAVSQELGPVDILVNNAGINPTKPFLELDLSDWNQTIQTNLTSAFLVSQAVLPSMRQRQWGRLIFLSSIAAQTGGVIGPHYAASKAGMLGLMHSYANLLAKEGITSNAIAPALIETEMVRQNKTIRPDMLPVGRFGHAEEVAQAVVFLASNSYTTGQTINLNGGWYMS
ncbi:3-oxoacyl-ACP reductase FabG [Edaphobacter sp. 4G125]|nr:3-oxoacyl-ACP reductase FabG [Edaphobacter sp. 4G125]